MVNAFQARGIEPWVVSAVTGEGVTELVRDTGRLVEAVKEAGSDDP
jgi:hypothetical protein